MLTVPHPPPTFYTCPGERHAISRAVHQARLSSHYAKCRECPHREDAGLVSLTRFDKIPPSQCDGLVFTADGLRGRYLNDLTRRHAQQWATALAVTLWNERPLTGRTASAADPQAMPSQVRSGPVVVVGYDERPASPDLALGVVTGLRQSGCQVIDVGQTTQPAWRFAAEQLLTDAGVFVTGAGHEASWTGLDLIGPGRVPLDPRTRLSDLVEDTTRVPRPTRFAGAVQTFAAWPAYESQLATHFHALRPLRVQAIALSPLLERLLVRLFAPLPCRLSFAATAPVAGPPLRWDVAVERLQAAVRNETGDVGVLLGEDGRQFALCDETGELVAPSVWQPWLLRALQSEQPGSQIAATTSSLADFVLRLRRTDIAGGVDPAGRFWHGGERPACDALLTLATLLRTLSWSDTTLSARLA
ncbi:MAG: hypothetical protein SH850_18710 [Planctomycetaceae bacterium]|nr:hypothetical protein [Planctomycetaceae bacterium]